MARASYKPIEDYGVVGDLHTVALIANDGSIDFMCFPHFDSPSVFAALLDRQRGGHFQIAPVTEPFRRRQMYLPDTNVLLTRFFEREGIAELSDFMPVEETGHAHNLVRRVKTVRGEMRYRMICEPKFDYGRAGHEIEHGDKTVVFVSRGPDKTALRLRTPCPITIRNGAAIAEFTLRAGEHASFILEDANAGELSPCSAPDYVSESFKQTVNFWRQWVARSTYKGRWREMVNRSALVLKLLFSQQHGSLVAAPTFGLPEQIGGPRNWDYRYTWIRDASFTLYALMRLGLHEEAGHFARWIEDRCGGGGRHGALQLMYGLDGRRELPETVLSHFEGYQGSSPVRIGNAAYDQLQLDIYGELIDAIYLYDKYGQPISHGLWVEVGGFADWLCDNWQQPDEGIWEVRGGKQEFLYSRVLCWVALDRAFRIARRRSLPAPLARWCSERDRIYRDVFEHFWDEKQGAFVQTREGTALDASALIMPLVRFISPNDPQWLSTLRAIEKHLVDDSLVYRYKNEDGLSGEEGTFSICSFWYVECLSRSGDLAQARFVFEKMLGLANEVGLYAEELGPCGEHLGNFPQAFTHLALISAAFDLDRRLSESGRE